MTDCSGNGATLLDISKEEYKSKIDVVYDVSFGNPNLFLHLYSKILIKNLCFYLKRCYNKDKIKEEI